MSVKTICRIQWMGCTMPFACSREGVKRSLQGEISQTSLLLKGFYVNTIPLLFWPGKKEWDCKHGSAWAHLEKKDDARQI